jgi:hypothetical protein
MIRSMTRNSVQPARKHALTLFVLLAVCCGWTRPQLPTRAKPPAADGQRLEYVLIAVNGSPHLVAAGTELTVIRGDVVTVQDAALSDRGLKVRGVHVVGFKGPNPRGDDRGTPFSTEDLLAKYSENKRGDLYAVLALSRSTLHGVVYLRLIEPILRYAEVSINGQTRVLRDGEPLAVKATDQVKVERVVTNLESTDGVLFQIATGDAPGSYAIRFSRGGAPFAQIPLKVAE